MGGAWRKIILSGLFLTALLAARETFAAPDWPIFDLNAQTAELVDETAPETSALPKKVLIDVIRINWKTYRFVAQTRGFFSQNLSYDWNFGDGQNSNVSSPKHIYGKPGAYVVRLTLTDKTTGLSYIAQPQVIQLSFFNLGNLKLWRLVGLAIIGLLFILRGLKILSRKASKRPIPAPIPQPPVRLARKKKNIL